MTIVLIFILLFVAYAVCKFPRRIAACIEDERESRRESRREVQRQRRRLGTSQLGGTVREVSTSRGLFFLHAYQEQYPNPGEPPKFRAFIVTDSDAAAGGNIGVYAWDTDRFKTEGEAQHAYSKGDETVWVERFDTLKDAEDAAVGKMNSIRAKAGI